jgi:hypothetical protein
MHDERADIRGTSSYAAKALKGQGNYWIEQVNLARRQRGLSAVGVTGRSWEQLSEVEKRNIQSAQTQDRLQAARDDQKLLELQAELVRLKAAVAKES